MSIARGIGVAAFISFVSVYLATESFGEDLTEEPAREPRGAPTRARRTVVE